MKKILLGVVIFVSCFCINFLDVNATSNSGYCIYNFEDEAIGKAWSSGQGNYLSVMINQTSDGTISYYFSKTKTTSSDSDDWEVLIDGEYVSYENDMNLAVSADGTYVDCPTYGYLEVHKNKPKTKFNVIFADDSSWGDTYIRSEFLGGLEGDASYSTDTVGATCEESDIDWIFDIYSYDVSCLYYADMNDGCYWAQLSFNKDDSDSLILKDMYGYEYTGDAIGFSMTDVNSRYGNNCPSTIITSNSGFKLSGNFGTAMLPYNTYGSEERKVIINVAFLN